MYIDVIWVFKIVYPVLVSLVPLAIYVAVREQFGQRIAFCSSFYFISSPIFFGSLLLFSREQIVYLFISLIVLVLADKELDHIHKSILIIVFLTGLPLSHYGLTYLFIISLINGKIILSLLNRFSQEQTRKNLNLFKSNIIVFVLVFTISWFLYIALGTSFQNVVYILSNTITNLNEFFDPNSRPEIAYAAMGGSLFVQSSLIGWIFRLLNYLIELSICVGFLILLLKPRFFELNKEYKTIMMANFLFMSIIFVPFWDHFLGMCRLFGFVLLTCSPFVVLGFEFGINALLRLSKMVSIKINHIDPGTSIKILMICVILPVLTLNIGLFSELTKDHLDTIEMGSSPVLERWNKDNGYFGNEEVSAAIWLKNYSNTGAEVLSDSRSRDLLTFWFPMKDIYRSSDNITRSDYLYLRRWNIISDQFIGNAEMHKSSIALGLNYSKIFDSNNAQIIELG
jgi:uncharacterized membrane protein